MYINPYLSGFFHSLSFFSRIPISQKLLKNGNSKMVAVFPFVGVLFGVLCIIFYEFLHLFFSQNYSLILTFCFFVYLSGAIHLDGVADTLDGLFAGREKAHIAMKDSRIGALGAIFLVLFLILKLAAFIELSNIYLFFAVPIVARSAILFLTFVFDYDKYGIKEEKPKSQTVDEMLLLFTLVALFLSICFGFLGALLLFCGLLFALLLAQYLKSYFGSLSGDNYGMCLESTEIFLLNLLILCV